MSCNPCDPCNNGHVPAVVSSPTQTVVVTRTGVDQQTFTVDVDPIRTVQLIVNTPGAVSVLCAALDDCVGGIDTVLVQSPLFGDGVSTPIGVDLNALVTLIRPLMPFPNAVTLADILADDPNAVAILCAALDGCDDDLHLVDFGTNPAAFGLVVNIDEDTTGIRRLAPGTDIALVQLPDGSLRIDSLAGAQALPAIPFGMIQTPQGFTPTAGVPQVVQASFIAPTTGFVTVIGSLNKSQVDNTAVLCVLEANTTLLSTDEVKSGQTHHGVYACGAGELVNVRLTIIARDPDGAGTPNPPPYNTMTGHLTYAFTPVRLI